jgi:hypothetical protein
MNVEDLIERNAPENYLLRLSDFELRILLHSLEASESALRRVGGALEQAGGELLEEVSKEIKLALRERWLIGSPFQAAKQGFSIRSLIALTPRKDQQETGH